MHSRLVRKEPQTAEYSRKKIIETTKTQKLNEDISDTLLTRSLQSTGKRGFQMWAGFRQTDIATYRLNRPRGKFSEKDLPFVFRGW